VNLVAMTENERRHFRVPEASLVTEVDTSFQHFTHCYCHESSPRGLGLKPAAASGAPCFSIEFPGSGAPDTLGAPACDSSPIFLYAFLPSRLSHRLFAKTMFSSLFSGKPLGKAVLRRHLQSRCRLSQRVYHAQMAPLKMPVDPNKSGTAFLVCPAEGRGCPCNR
jgi:hypothetical protein